MVSIRVDVTRAIRELERGFDDLQRRQIPYAASQAINVVAAKVAAAEVAEMTSRFGPITPFTKNAMAVRRASKQRLNATIYVKDIQAAYLEPYMPGGSGRQVLKANHILEPIDLKPNQYGNIPKGKLEQLKARSDVFIGTVTFRKTGEVIYGVWQRGERGKRRKGGYGNKGLHHLKHNAGFGLNAKTTLKLLIAFDDPKAVRPRLSYDQVAKTAIERDIAKELDKAMTKALATARP